MEENLNTNLINEVEETVMVEATNSIPDYKKGVITGLVIGGTALLGTIIYKKVVKPRLAAKHNQEDEIEEVIEAEVEETEESNVED